MKVELLVWAWLCVSVAVIGPATGKKKYSRSGNEAKAGVMPRTPTYSDAYMGTLRCLKLHEGSTTYFFHVNGVCALFSCRVKEFYGDKKVRVKPYGCKCPPKAAGESSMLAWPHCCAKCGEGGRGAPNTGGKDDLTGEDTSTEASNGAGKPEPTESPSSTEAGAGNGTTTVATDEKKKSEEGGAEAVTGDGAATTVTVAETTAPP